MSMKRKSSILKDNSRNKSSVKKLKITIIEKPFDRSKYADLMSLGLTKGMIKDLAQKIIDNTEVKDGHLIWTKKQLSAIKVNGINKYPTAWYHLLTTGDICKDLDVQYRTQCDVEKCISHSIPVQNNLDSIAQMTVWDVEHYMNLLESKSEPKGECRVWTGVVNLSGYGNCNYLNQSYAHAVSWMIYNGQDIPEDKMVTHLCKKTPACIRPEHLALGNPLKNAQDRVRDGTQPRGEKSWSASITDKVARQIIDTFGNGESRNDRAEKFGTTMVVIRGIDQGKKWKHLMTEHELKIRADQLARGKMKEGMIKMTYETACKIRKYAEKNKTTQAVIATKFKTSANVVSAILRNKSFKSPKMPLEERRRKQRKKYFKKTRKRVRSHIDIIEDDEGEIHWMWNAGYLFGYGHSSFRDKTMNAHVVSYLAFNELDEVNADCVRHKCIHKGCVRPEHLEPGTWQQNSDDRERDNTVPRGQNHPNSLITEEVARKIKLSKGEGTQKDRAKEFNVSIGIINAIDIGNSWTHL